MKGERFYMSRCQTYTVVISAFDNRNFYLYSRKVICFMRLLSLAFTFLFLFWIRATVIFSRYLKLFKDADVTPLVVFDGQKLPAKTEENDRRQRYYKE